MKFGVIMHKPTTNIGDDIQTYAAAKLLPQVDYAIDRESINTFQSKNNEPVAVIMNAWWMWKKWNWPPADCIIPKLVSIHVNNYGIERKSSPIENEWICGCGREYMEAYGPVGCRDQSTLDFFEKQGIDAYFSGCLTLTLPKQKQTADAKQYVCLVDLNTKLEAKARELLKDTGLEIRVISHKCDYRRSFASLEKRFNRVEEVLIQYQNAKFVITRRLHVTLPCLALETPVLSVVDLKDIGNITRWEPYVDMLHCIDNDDFLNNNFDFGFQNPPKNKGDYLRLRKQLMEDVAEFIRQYGHCEQPLAAIRKTRYTSDEKLLWQNEMMQVTLEKWLEQSRDLLAEKQLIEKKYRNTRKKLRRYSVYVKELQDAGVITEVDLPEVSEKEESEFQLKKKVLKKKIWEKLKSIMNH